jgi:hypothetical protein
MQGKTCLVSVVSFVVSDAIAAALPKRAYHARREYLMQAHAIDHASDAWYSYFTATRKVVAPIKG